MPNFQTTTKCFIKEDSNDINVNVYKPDIVFSIPSLVSLQSEHQAVQLTVIVSVSGREALCRRRRELGKYEIDGRLKCVFSAGVSNTRPA